MSHGKQFTLYTHVGGPNGWYVSPLRPTSPILTPRRPSPRPQEGRDVHEERLVRKVLADAHAAPEAEADDVLGPIGGVGPEPALGAEGVWLGEQRGVQVDHGVADADLCLVRATSGIRAYSARFIEVDLHRLE